VSKYDDWIKANYNRESSYGQCKSAVELMKSEFPELTITNGFVEDVFWDQREHWWLKTPEGEIVDPTKSQFNCVLSYTEIDDSHPSRNYESGTCANCGEHYYIGKDNWTDRTVCDNQCWKAYRSYLMSDM
jgi:hypothetical protein